MKILMAASECVPYVKVGGLADVVGSLPRFLKSRKHDVRVIIPKYQKIDEQKCGLVKLPFRLRVPIAGRIENVSLWEGRLDGSVPVYFVANNTYFNRPGIYGTPDGEYADSRQRFILFSRAVLEAAKALLFQPDVVHCHDWQTGIIPAYLKTVYSTDGFFWRTASLHTIHNIAYQGSFDASTVKLAGLPSGDFTWEKLEFFGRFNFMKVGLVYADMLSTVSPAYSREIQHSAEFGCGMEGILKSRSQDLAGILNGVDYDRWDPTRDQYLESAFSKNDTNGKVACKEDLQRACGLPIRPDVFLMGCVSRLDAQKGFSLITSVIPKLAKRDIQLVILGSGDRKLQHQLSDLAGRNPSFVSFNLGFNDPLAHRIYAGSDAFLMPSLFEPCGLSQMIALAYGTIPIVHRTGGLVDTVSEFLPSSGKGNGFVFSPAHPDALLSAIGRAHETFRRTGDWKKLVRNAFSCDFSWERQVKEYIKLYQRTSEKVQSAQ